MGRTTPGGAWHRYLSLGAELAAAIAIPTWVGDWLDRNQGSAPWGILGGFFFGLAGGFFLFVRSSLQALREARKSDASISSSSKNKTGDGQRGPLGG